MSTEINMEELGETIVNLKTIYDPKFRWIF